jgi:hypothetical protein
LVANDLLAARQEVQRRTVLLDSTAPTDGLTRLACWLTKGLQRLIKPVNRVIPLTTAAVGLITNIQMVRPVYQILLSVVRLPFLAIIVGSSWLWLKAPWLRPLLLVILLPLFSMLVYLALALLPDYKKGDKYWNLALCDSWPLSWLLLRPAGEQQRKSQAPTASRATSAKVAKKARNRRR